MPEVVIVGGGHNALVAAAYLGRAGHSVLMLERSDHLGGAAISAEAFPGAHLSRYSYLVSLLPPQIVADLGLRIDLIRRSTSSYTPDPSDPSRGLLIAEREASFERIGASGDAEAWHEFYGRLERMAQRLFPTVLQPLPTRSSARALLDDEGLWQQLFAEPIGHAITSTVESDVVRGVVATDALIGTFADLEADLEANRCFLYHLLGGPWDVPRGGMGSVSGAIAAAAQRAGAQLRTGAEVTAVDPGGQVHYRHQGNEHGVSADLILCGAASQVLAGLIEPGTAAAGSDGAARPRAEGAQVKVNLLLDRLPRLADSEVKPEAAFGGTFHINETYSQLQQGWQRAAHGEIPDPLPCEIYCHSLTDPSILDAELQRSGAQTLTVFGLHTPHRWTDDVALDVLRERLGTAVLTSLNTVLGEPIEDVIATTPDGRQCIEVKTTADLAADLVMPAGHIFHGPLSWPFAADDEPLDTPARRWGVATGHDRVLLCGAGAVRGGAVSGIGGHNAAMAAIELLGR